MAKSKDGPFGKLSGKVGNLVFATWKGIPYIRSRPSGNPSNTKAQQTQRSKFGMVVKFVGRILPVIKAGFKWQKEQLPARNAAISYLMKNAVRGEKPDIWIDFSSVFVARGNLPPPREATAERTSDNILSIRWTYHSGLAAKRASDKVLALAYIPELKQGIWSIDGTASRDDEHIILELPDAAVQKEAHVYLAFADAEGNDASDSVYLGAE
jgi:hypothetical protein